MKQVERINIENIDDPVTTGILDQFRIFRGKFQVDYGKPAPIKTGYFSVTMSEQHFYALSRPPVAGSEDLSHVKGRLFHLLNDQLMKHLFQNPENIDLHIQLSNSDVDDLMAVDPNREDRGGWTDLRSSKNQLIFISCGQQTDQEKKLGSGIARLVEEHTAYTGYFADFQDSLEGVTENIFEALHKAVGFIAVMHKRDSLDKSSKDFRGSVWMEQEIAISAFLAQALGEKIPVRLYVQEGIRREGVRGYIIHKPIKFESDKEVIKDVEEWLKKINNQLIASEETSNEAKGKNQNNNFSNILRIIESSRPNLDWKTTYIGSMTVSIFRKDTNLRIEQIHQETGVHTEDFREAWANGFPDPKATAYYYDIYYGSSLIDQIVLISVDGGRANLPLPQSIVDLRVSKLHYQIAKIFDSPDILDKYMDKAKLSVDENI